MQDEQIKHFNCRPPPLKTSSQEGKIKRKLPILDQTLKPSAKRRSEKRVIDSYFDYNEKKMIKTKLPIYQNPKTPSDEEKGVRNE